MENKYISEGRYRKVVRTKKRTRGLNKKIDSNRKNDKKVIKKTKTKKRYILPKWFVKTIKLSICALLLSGIALISRIAMKEKDEPIIPAFLSGKQEVENVDTVVIGIYGDNNLQHKGINNVVLTELEEYIYPVLLRINKDYSLEYNELKSIEKINNREYKLVLKENSSIVAENIKSTIESIKKDKNNSNNYKLDNVENVEAISERELKISLKTDDEYFPYNLCFPIYDAGDNKGVYSIDKNNTNANKLNLIRNEGSNKELVKNIAVTNVSSETDAVTKYKNGEIDVLFSDSLVAEKLLGKYEYNIKAYDSGETIMLFINPTSERLNKKEMRQAVAYSIDRENVIEKLSDGKGRVIDIPYIFDEVKYKYDIYAAENLLLSNGYAKQNGVYYKLQTNEVFSLELLVNSGDNEKIGIAENIKTNLEAVGIKVNINSLSENQIQKRVNTGDYDLVLATVQLNDNPNINHIDNIKINSIIEEKANAVKNASISNMSDEINSLKKEISNNIGVIGIMSKNIYVIYRKNITVFGNIGYMNLFSDYIVTTNNVK